MKKSVVTTLMLIVFFSGAFAQKKEKINFDIDKKAQTFTVNGQPVFKFEESKNMVHPAVHNYYFTNLEGKKLILIVYKSYNSFAERTQSNPQGSVSYYEVNFLDGKDNKPVEIGYNFLKKIGELFYEKGVIKDGQLDEESIKMFLMESGTPFSDKRP